MRILIVSGLYPNRRDPHRGVYIHRQAVALKRRAQVRVIAPVPYFPGFVKSHKYSRFSSIPGTDEIEGVEVTYPRYLVVPKLFRFHHGIMVALCIHGPLRRVVREFGPDVIIGFFAYPYGFATVWLAKLLRVPVVIGVLGSDVNIMARSGLKRHMVRHSLNASDKVLSVCRALKDATAELGVQEDKIVVIPNGVDADRFPKVTRSDARLRLRLPSTGQIVLCISNLVHVKGVDVVIRAFGGLGDGGQILTIVGDGGEKGRLQRMVAEMGLEERVHFVGAKPPTEVPLWIAASDLVVLGSRAEGHPNVIVEALAGGRPVVATDVGGVSDTVTSRELGLIVEPEDPEAMTAAMRTALARQWDEEAIRSVGVGRTWDDVAGEIMVELEPLVTPPATGV